MYFAVNPCGEESPSIPIAIHDRNESFFNLSKGAKLHVLFIIFSFQTIATMNAQTPTLVQKWRKREKWRNMEIELTDSTPPLIWTNTNVHSKMQKEGKMAKHAWNWTDWLDTASTSAGRCKHDANINSSRDNSQRWLIFSQLCLHRV